MKQNIDLFYLCIYAKNILFVGQIVHINNPEKIINIYWRNIWFSYWCFL